MSDIDELIRQLKESTGFKTSRGRKATGGGRSGSDEYYVVGLCNEALGLEGEQQYKFPFLVGDSGRALPVDAYYRGLNLVVEYYERQHSEEVKFFNRRMTVSGVSRRDSRVYKRGYCSSNSILNIVQ